MNRLEKDYIQDADYVWVEPMTEFNNEFLDQFYMDVEGWDFTPSDYDYFIIDTHEKDIQPLTTKEYDTLREHQKTYLSWDDTSNICINLW